jgi:hypothetical protein
MTPSVYEGRAFGRLTVLADLGRANGVRMWMCVCDCGEAKAVRHGGLQSGNTKSCGCSHLDANRARLTTHGMAWSPTWKSWLRMRERCEKHPHYAGRGIKVCERWQDFANFLADMGERKAGMTLDRINVDGNYEPGNCRWADQDTQSNNKRSNRVIEAFGRSQTLSQWAKERRLSVATLWARLDVYNMSVEDALSTPVRK